MACTKMRAASRFSGRAGIRLPTQSNARATRRGTEARARGVRGPGSRTAQAFCSAAPSFPSCCSHPICDIFVHCFVPEPALRLHPATESVGRRADVTQEARQLGNGLAQLAALAGILEEEARAVQQVEHLARSRNVDPQAADELTLAGMERVHEVVVVALERVVAVRNADDAVQFERLGYFCPDKDSTPERLVFNRTVGLRDTWAKVSGGSGGGA